MKNGKLRVALVGVSFGAEFFCDVLKRVGSVDLHSVPP